jgi:hypothetical protein
MVQDQLRKLKAHKSESTELRVEKVGRCRSTPG